MDLKKFGAMILLLGLLICGYGGFVWLSNQPITYERPPATNSIMGGLNALEKMMSVQDENYRRAGEREYASSVLLGGGIVVFLGIAFILSAKRKGPAKTP